MRTILTVTLCLVVGFAPVTVSAANYNEIQRGETWHLDKIFENQLVQILGKRNGRIKVGYLDGGVDWVHPSELLTRYQSNVDDAGETLAGLGIATIILICGFNPDSCKDAAR